MRYLRVVRSLETESRMLAARGEGRRKWGTVSWAQSSCFAKWKSSGDGPWRQLHKNVNTRNTAVLYGAPWWLGGKEPVCQCRRCRFDPGLARSPGEGNGNTLQHSCLGNPKDRGACRATVHGVAKSWTRLSN